MAQSLFYNAKVTVFSLFTQNSANFFQIYLQSGLRSVCAAPDITPCSAQVPLYELQREVQAVFQNQQLPGSSPNDSGGIARFIR